MYLIESVTPSVDMEGISAYFEPPVFSSSPKMKIPTTRLPMSVRLMDCVVFFAIEGDKVNCEAYFPETKGRMRFTIFCPAKKNDLISQKLKFLEETVGDFRVALNGKL